MNNQSKENNARMYLFLGGLGVLVCAVFGVAAWTAVNHPAFASILPGSPSPAPRQENLWAQVEIAKPLPNSVDVSMFTRQSVDDSTSLNAIPEPASTDQPADVPAEASISIP